MLMEKDIYALHETLVEYIENNIFSTNMIRKLSFQFQWLLRYMEENSIEMYSKEIGLVYLKSGAKPDNRKIKKGVPYNYKRRYITLLNGMLDDEWVRKIATKVIR